MEATDLYEPVWIGFGKDQFALLRENDQVAINTNHAALLDIRVRPLQGTCLGVDTKQMAIVFIAPPAQSIDVVLPVDRCVKMIPNFGFLPYFR